MTLTALLLILGMLLVHWVADFVLQTDDEAKLKSSDTSYLLAHTSHYAFVWFIVMTVYGFYAAWPAMNVIYFTGITWIMHTITDYFTSRLNKKLWEKGRVHDFFVSIGGDQILHYTQLLLTFYLLS